MARIEASVQIDMTNTSADAGEVVRATSTELVISDGINSVVYEGYGLSYSGHGVTGGTLTGYYFYQGQLPVGGFYDISIPVGATPFTSLPALLLSGLSGNDILLGSPYGDILTGLDGDDIVIGGYGDDALYGGNGNDFLSGQAGNNYIDGGHGFDQVDYAGSVSQYEYRVGSDGTVEVRDFYGQQYDHLVSVERLVFEDVTIAFDFDGNAGQAYRLYQAAFDRTPDAEGLGFWIKALDDGSVNLNAAANYFVQSEEFAGLYGNPDQVSNAEFIDLLYLNILDRNAEGEGFEFWLGQMNAGNVDKDDVLAYFSESAENISLVADAIDNGIWFV